MIARLTAQLLEWNMQQRLHFRTLRKLCLPATWPLAGLWAALMAVLVFTPLPFALQAALAVPTALLPLAILLHWLIPVPQIWNIHGSWVAIGMLATSALLALFGQFFAGIVLNGLFAEAPNLFPIAYGAGTYFGAIFGLAAAIACLALTLFIFESLFTFIDGLRRNAPKRRLLRDARIFAVLALAIIAPLASTDFIDQLATKTLRKIALEADFFPDYRCQTDGWPKGITRVAFIGDEQALGYRAGDDQLIVLHCIRQNIQGRISGG